jgi:hypothetical protein
MLIRSILRIVSSQSVAYGIFALISAKTTANKKLTETNTKQVAKDLYPFALHLFALTPLARNDNLTGDLLVMMRLCSKAYESEFDYP